MEKPPTLRELAARLGVSHATVSMALRNSPAISKATRLRVQALAKEAGYHGNILVSALLSQVRRGRLDPSGEVIALLVEGSGRDANWRPDLVEGVKSAKHRALKSGLTVEVFPLGQRGCDSKHVGRVLSNRGTRGIILAPMSLMLQPLEIDWNLHAVLAVGYSFQQQEMHRVANAHFNGLLCAYGQLRSRGYRRIGCMLLRDEDERARHYWLAAALAAPRVHGGVALVPLMQSCPPDEMAFRKWFIRTRPDALIGNQPDYALEWLRKMKVRVPDDVGYASLDVMKDTGIAGIRQSWGGMFAAAVDQLTGELARNEFGLPVEPKVTLIEGTWVDGETVKRR